MYENEEWRPCEIDIFLQYDVSNLGRVRRQGRIKPIKNDVDELGNRFVMLYEFSILGYYGRHGSTNYSITHYVPVDYLVSETFGILIEKEDK